jgi:hypothetical protein
VQYAFADTDVAERRLALVAETFAPATTAFLHDVAPQARALAVDLGCGPGHTTRLLASVLGCTRTVGLDGSARFIAAARAAGGDSVEFHRARRHRAPLPDSARRPGVLSLPAESPPRAGRRPSRGWATQLAPRRPAARRGGRDDRHDAARLSSLSPDRRRGPHGRGEASCTSGPTLAAVPDTGRSAGGRAAWRRSGLRTARRAAMFRTQHSRMARPRVRARALRDEDARPHRRRARGHRRRAGRRLGDITWGLRQLVLADA